MESVDPRRANDRNDREDAKWTKSKTDSDDPKRAKLLIESVLPKSNSPRTERVLVITTASCMDNVLKGAGVNTMWCTPAFNSEIRR
jgi:hypothetical protein